LSFAAIQQEQQDHDQEQDPKGKRSLLEIQKEEQALREEEDFLKWWTAQEQRLKVETEVAHVLMADSGSSNIRGRGIGRRARGSGSRHRVGNGRGGYPTAC